MEKVALYKCKVVDKNKGKSYFTKNNKCNSIYYLFTKANELENIGD
jgi:hypothetical protein